MNILRLYKVLLTLGLMLVCGIPYTLLFKACRENIALSIELREAQQDAKDAAMQLNEARATIGALNGASKL